MEQYDWNSAIPDVKPVENLPAGTYWFRVVACERKMWDHGKLMGAAYCDLDLDLWTEGICGACKAKLTLHSKTMFHVRNFWRAVGAEVESGKPFVPDWNGIIGQQGRCKVGMFSFTPKDGGDKRTVNVVDDWVKSDGSLPPPFPTGEEDNGQTTAANDDVPF